MPVKIKTRDSTEDKRKRSLAADLMLYLACKKYFYNRLNEILQNLNIFVTINFHDMQNQSLPKTSVGKAYD
jgi:hypothetical protein